MTISENLNKIWSEFRKVGITDDLVVIEYLARLLLEESGLQLQPPEKIAPLRKDHYIVKGFINKNLDHHGLTQDNLAHINLIPRLPTIKKTYWENIKNYLTQAIQEATKQEPDKNQNSAIFILFNHHILFRLSTRQSGGRYPTPRHITKFIYNLAQIETHHSLADFACGSGGFLVERELTIDNFAKTWGIDISPEWIRLAYTNIALRKLPPLLRSGNALEVATSDSLTFKQAKYKTFDRILIAPSFGEKIDSKLASAILGKSVGSRSETALTTLAIQKLSDDGIAGILVPSGLLFSNSKAERELRQTLIDDYHLKAVITLPKDALQPYSSLQSHLLLIHKLPQANNTSQLPIEGENDTPQPLIKREENYPQFPVKRDEKLTWFFQLEEDGYSSGRSRDLTQKPDLLKSDFPFVEKVFERQGDEFD
ncbi:MAG: class I SAM-dependent DNA methyltransferase, partial [Microcystaceae cyanobacterium]